MHRAPASQPIGLLEELSLRRWARENYVPASARSTAWHPVVLDEMQCKEAELVAALPVRTALGALVPLDPGQWWNLHEPHVETKKTECLLRVPNVVDGVVS